MVAPSVISYFRLRLGKSRGQNTFSPPKPKGVLSKCELDVRLLSRFLASRKLKRGLHVTAADT